MAANLDSIEGKLTSLEQILNSISTNTGGFKSLDNAAFNAGMKSLFKKMDASDKVVTKIQNILQNNSKNGSGSTNIHKVISEINGHVKNIDSVVSKNINKISGYAKDTVDYLKKIEGHVGKISPSSKNAPKNTTPNGGIKHIEGRVDDIYDELKKIHLDLSTNFNGSTGNATLDKKILANRKIEEKEKNWELRKKALENGKVYDKQGRELKKGSKNWNETKRQIEQEEKERAKIADKHKKDKEKPRRVASAINGISNFLSPNQKASASGLMDKGISALSQVNPIAGAIVGALKAVLELGSKLDRATSDFARTIGGNAQGKFNIGTTVQKAFDASRLGAGYTTDAMLSALTEVAEARGRTTERMSAAGTISAVDLKRFGIGGEAINNFDTFGKSLEETDKYFAKLYSQVSKKGLSFKNVSKAVNDNLKAAQKYGFQNGIAGLEKMAEKSTQLKYNMQQVFTLAEKVQDVEGAINVGANLSVLGGTFAQYSNPLQLLYESLNDTEALQERIQKIFSGKAFWDQEKGQINMSAMDKRFVREAAGAMGLNPDEMLNISFNEARIKKIQEQISPGLGKDTAEYIKNIAELDKNGNAMVTLSGITKAVSQLTEADKTLLEKESRAKDKSATAKLGDIYMSTISIGEKVDNILQYLKDFIGRWVFGLFKRFTGNLIERQTIAQGEGSESLQKARLQLFDSGKLGRGRAAAVKAGSMSETELAQYGISIPKAANGFSPDTFALPGNRGIITGKSHLEGGIAATRNGQPIEIEGGETLIGKLQSAIYRNELNQIRNGTFNPVAYANEAIKNDMARHLNSMAVAPVKAATPIAPQTGNMPINGTIKIDIPQTITINLSNGGKIGDYDVSQIIANYVDKFMKDAMIRGKLGGFDKENFYNQSTVI